MNTKNKKSSRNYSDFHMLKRLAGYIFDSKFTMVMVLVLIVLNALSSVYAPYLTAQIIDALESSQELFYTLLLLQFGVWLLQQVVYFFQRYQLSIIGEKAVYKLRNDTYRRLQEQSLDYFDETPNGEILSRLTNDLNSMQPILSGQVLFAVSSLIAIVGYFWIMISISIPMTLLSLVAAPLLVLITQSNKRFVRPVLAKVRKQMGKLSSTMTENIMGAKVSMAFARSESNQDEFNKINRELTDTYDSYFLRSGALAGFYEIFHVIMQLTVLLGAAFLMQSGIVTGISIGEFYLFFMYLSSLFGPLMTIANLYDSLQNSFTAYERILEIHDRQPLVVSDKNAKYMQIVNGNIKFDNVAFHYPKTEEYLFESFNLEIKPREILGIVGRTGSGKTSIANLLSRLYEIDTGRILIDGIDIQSVNVHSLRKSIGVVLQEPALHSETIRYNLTYGEEIPDNQLFEVLNLVGADFVKELPAGLDTVLGERGNRLSLGQKQLIAFARSLVSDPKILILDEATSSIDPQSELRIQRAMTKMFENRTTIMIAHRLSTIQKADRIIVLEEGKIIEQGGFQELLELKGHFHNLYQHQYAQLAKSKLNN